MNKLTSQPAENGAAKITGGPFYDEDTPPNIVTPSAISWTLTTLSGVVVNGKEAQSLTPATTIEFMISGADLALPSSGDRKRVVTVSFTYASTLGPSVTSRVQAEFEIEKFAYNPSS